MSNQDQAKWYDNKLVVYLLIILFFPVGLYALWKNNHISKPVKWIVTGVLAFFVIAVYNADPPAETKAEETENKKPENIVQNAEQSLSQNETTGNSTQPNAQLQDLYDEIESLKKGYYDFSKIRESKESIRAGLELFDLWTTKVLDAENSNDDEIKKAALELRKVLTNVQIAEFPKLRKSYADVFKQDFWLENMEISVKGKGNTTIEFTGIAFANNRNIAEFQSTVVESLSRFRFKRVHYKNGISDEYTYYDIPSKKDSEIK